MFTRNFRIGLKATVLLGFLTIGFVAQAQPNPSVLYHWTSARGLDRWASAIDSQQGLFVLKTMTDSIFTAAYPAYKGAPGVFAWTNVAASMGAFSLSAQEWYAREDKSTGEAARLVAITLKSGTHPVVLDTYLEQTVNIPRITETDPKSSSMAPGDRNGLILHRVFDSSTRELMFQEYILLKSGFVASITADPIETGPVLRSELQRLQSSQPYSKDELHFLPEQEKYGINSNYLRQQAADVIERALAVPSERIPSLFRSNTCDLSLR